MTIEEAFEEIGLAPGVPAGEIRRAYLRQLKTRKPEVDPEGFRRLREAYETLSALPREEEPEVAPYPGPAATFPSPAPFPTDPAPPEPSAEPVLSPVPVFRRLLELHADGKLAEAAALEASFRERLHASGRELGLLDDEFAIVWSVVQELGQLDDGFPQAARTAIASAMLAGDLLAAWPAIERIAQAEAWRAPAIASRLYPLPVLFLFHEAFHLPPPPLTIRPTGPSKVNRTVEYVVVGVILAIAGFSVFHDSTKAPEPAPAVYTSLEDGLSQICHPVTSGMENICSAAREGLESIEWDNCHGVQVATYALRQATSDFDDDPVPGIPAGGPRGLLKVLEQRARPLCGDL